MEENRIYKSHKVALVVKNLPTQKAQEIRFQSLGWEDTLVGSGNPLQYSCLENSMNREAWSATVHRAAESRTWLSTITIKLLPVQFGSVAQSCLTLRLSITNSQSLLKLMSIESVMTSNHLILSSPSPPAFSLSQHQDLFKEVSSSHQVAKILEFQLQHQSFQWTPRTTFL